jgi:hypothetical protein
LQIFGGLFVEPNMEVSAMGSLSIKIRKTFGTKKPLDEHRLMTWYEDALDLENACRYWEKAAELQRRKRMRIKIRKTAGKAA